MSAPTPGQAVYEAHQAFMIHCFPGIAPIAWDELSPEAQAGQEGIARAGIAAYIKLNGRDPVDAASVIAEVIVPELAAVTAERDDYAARLRAADQSWTRVAVERDGLRERLEAAEAKAAAYESGISWGTSCTSCAAVLDSSVAETFRRERAEQKIAEAREGIGNFLAQYGDSDILMFKVAQDLANSLMKVLDGGGP